jgi:hypothetical protein
LLKKGSPHVTAGSFLAVASVGFVVTAVSSASAGCGGTGVTPAGVIPASVVPADVSVSVLSVNGVPSVDSRTVAGSGTFVSATASSTPGGTASASASAYTTTGTGFSQRNTFLNGRGFSIP